MTHSLESRPSPRRRFLPLIAGLGLLALAPGAAFAHANLFFGINLGGFFPAPVYVAPPPVVYGPPAVVYSPPPRVYYAPRPVYYGYGWRREEWHERREWREHHDWHRWDHDRR